MTNTSTESTEPKDIVGQIVNNMIGSITYEKSEELVEKLREYYTSMFTEGKNIPITKELVKLLPVGYTPTAVVPSSRPGGGSKYFRPKVWPLQHLNFKGVLNKINLEPKD